MLALGEGAAPDTAYLQRIKCTVQEQRHRHEESFPSSPPTPTSEQHPCHAGPQPARPPIPRQRSRLELQGPKEYCSLPQAFLWVKRISADGSQREEDSEWPIGDAFLYAGSPAASIRSFSRTDVEANVLS